MGMGLALYVIANIYDTMSSESIIKTTVKCRYCRKRISSKVLFPISNYVHTVTYIYQAKRCINCTSWQDGREDTMD